jgi:hypothetical protein
MPEAAMKVLDQDARPDDAARRRLCQREAKAPEARAFHTVHALELLHDAIEATVDICREIFALTRGYAVADRLR